MVIASKTKILQIVQIVLKKSIKLRQTHDSYMFSDEVEKKLLTRCNRHSLEDNAPPIDINMLYARYLHPDISKLKH